MRLLATLGLVASLTIAACGPAATASVPAVSPTPDEAQLLANVRLDLKPTCAPIRDALPAGAIAAIECRPASDAVGRVGVILFGTQDDLMRTYLGTLEERGVEPRTNGGRCLPDEPSEGAYTPGDDGPVLSPTRSACFAREDGGVQYLATLPPFVLIELAGIGADPEAVEQFAWLGNQDTPGSPTIWSATGPCLPKSSPQATGAFSQTETCWRLSLVNGRGPTRSSDRGDASRPARPSGPARPATRIGTGSTRARSPPRLQEWCGIEALVGDVVLVEPPGLRRDVEAWTSSPGGRRRSSGTWSR